MATAPMAARHAIGNPCANKYRRRAALINSNHIGAKYFIKTCIAKKRFASGKCFQSTVAARYFQHGRAHFGSSSYQR